MNIKVISSDNIDGMGCAHFIKSFYDKDNVIIKLINNNYIDDNVFEFLNSKEYMNYDIVYLTNLTINEMNADIIDNLKNNCLFKLFSKYKSALWLNKYSWCAVDNNIKSTTLLCQQHINDTIKIN